MILTQIIAAWRRWRLYRQTVAELAMLNDREPGDPGISRSDIRTVARETSSGHRPRKRPNHATNTPLTAA